MKLLVSKAEVGVRRGVHRGDQPFSAGNGSLRNSSYSTLDIIWRTRVTRNEAEIRGRDDSRAVKLACG